MRTLLSLVALSLAAFLVFGARPSPDQEWSLADSPVVGDWPTEWEVFCPGRSGTSPVPSIAFVTPGWAGPVEVTIEASGRRSVKVTPARTLSWPDALPPLSPGESCRISVAGASGKAAVAVYLRLPDFDRSGTMSRAGGR